MTCPLTIQPGTLISTRLIICEAPPRHGLLCFPSDRVSPAHLPKGCYFRSTRPILSALVQSTKRYLPLLSQPNSTSAHMHC